MTDVRANLQIKYRLSQRELDTAELCYKNLKNDDIAELMGIGQKTVKFHLTNIFKKCEVSSRKELIRLIDKTCQVR